MIETTYISKTLSDTLSANQTEKDFNLKISCAVLNYILSNENSYNSVKSYFANRHARVVREDKGGYIKSLIASAVNEVDCNEFPLFYQILNYAIEIIDYEWVEMNIFVALHPGEMEELFSE